MNKKIGYITIGVLVIAIIIVYSILIKEMRSEREWDPVIEYVGVSEKKLLESKNIVFTDADELNKLLKKTVVTEDDMKYNHYALIEVKTNSCSEKNVIPTSHEIKGGKIKVSVNIKKECGICAPMYNYFILPIDKKITNLESKIKFNYIGNEKCNDMTVKKPIIYLYPEEKTNIEVKILTPEKLTTSYPKYNNSWLVEANPSGKLIDLKTNKELYALYYEGKDNHKKEQEEGFIVKGEDISSFLEEKLTILGLNAKEQEEFIIYWLPILENNKYNYIRFESLEEINEYMPLDINPKPDTLIRILMDYKPLDSYKTIKEQKLTKVVRKGYTVVEWGGTRVE